MRRLVALTLLAFALVAAHANASVSTVKAGAASKVGGPTIAQSIAIAERWIADAGVENTCAGTLRIDWEASPQDADGQIDGYTDSWVADGLGGWVWDRTRCHIVLRSGLGAVDRCGILGHELMHAVRGPNHDGPLPSTRTVPSACGGWKLRYYRGPSAMKPKATSASAPATRSRA